MNTPPMPIPPLPDYARNALIRAYQVARAARLAELDREQARDNKPAA